jgi:hypothetical protein
MDNDEIKTNADGTTVGNTTPDENTDMNNEVANGMGVEEGTVEGAEMAEGTVADEEETA